MRFGVLGSLAVWTTAGTPVPIPGLKVRAVLADLLVHAGRPIAGDRLIDDVWGEHPPGNAAGTLSAKISQLRRAFEDAEPGARELVVSPPPGYRLNAAADAVDASQFESLIADAGRAHDPRAAADLLIDALALWRGRAYADFADESFTQPAITRLEEQRLVAIEDLALLRLELGEHAQLAGDLADHVAEHPLRERLRAAHMRALYRAGRQRDALDSFAELRTRLADELGLDPGPEVTDLQRAILDQDPALAAPPERVPTVARRQSNLPTPLAGLIGRDDVLDELRTAIPDTRLLTLTGPGGVGKTRLAIAAAHSVAESFPGGALLVELAGLDRTGAASTAVLDAVSTVLDIRDSADDLPIRDRIAAAVRERQLLLVLDNCEHLIDPVADIAELLVEAAPGLRILATSREPINLPGELVWSVAPLEIPARGADIAELERSSAVQLFVSRAAAGARDFGLDDSTAAPVATLCRRLDGIPLALELAANRVRTLGVHEMVSRLDDRFRLLATGHRGAPPRQQTLAAMIDWSWELLAEPEQIALRRLAVHVDGCTLAAAEFVCAADDLPVEDVSELVIRLVDRSLVTVVHANGQSRYRLLESVAAYALARLSDAGEVPAVQHRHRAYYTQLALDAEPQLNGPNQHAWLRLLDSESANLRSAFDGALAASDSDQALQLASSLVWYRFLRGRLAEAKRTLDAAAALPDADRSAVARARAWSVGIAQEQGCASDSLADALDATAAIVDPHTRARAYWFLAFTGMDSGNLSSASDRLDTALDAFAALDDQWGTAATKVAKAHFAHIRGDVAQLELHARSAAEIFDRLGDRWGQLRATEWLGGLAELTGDLDSAADYHRNGLDIAQELELWPDVSSHLSWLGWIAHQRGDYVAAQELCEPALRMAKEQGSRSGAIFASLGLSFAARKAGDLDSAEPLLRSMLRDAEPTDDTAEPPIYLPMILAELGFVMIARGDAARARELHLSALDYAITLDAPRDTAYGLEGLATALAMVSELDGAATLLGAAAALRKSAGMPLAPAESSDVDRITESVVAGLGVEPMATALATGAELTPVQARAVAIGPLIV
ncbi:BTAD domain-containing putative transcriptional regulator [Antrihabitans cavernicola]|uniref:AfsR/SARP family transcriptional regulator n=1 Tax=Antrihabitans cavernicola TaxID=2495913 RepID=A0A5A7SKF7_9NOCA|nr:BTAD domain-containing putative transcriptional regulator [Spelaeibacter cavernicola]KAA0024945.1 AfsR/SARP family transcriptional regulator [Spelaeibacter cavernicola]